MNKKNIIFLISALSLIVICSFIIISATEPSTHKHTSNESSPSTTNEFISATFANLKQELDLLEDDDLIAKGHGIEVTKKRFTFYKRNVEMTHQLQGLDHEMNDLELIENMLKDKLTIQYAENIGITVTPEEIDEVVENERSILNDPSLEGESNQLIQEIMDHRIQMTGLSEGEFWNSDEIRNLYKNAIITTKLHRHLTKNGEIRSFEDFIEFKKDLLADKKDQIELFYHP